MIIKIPSEFRREYWKLSDTDLQRLVKDIERLGKQYQHDKVAALLDSRGLSLQFLQWLAPVILAREATERDIVFELEATSALERSSSWADIPWLPNRYILLAVALVLGILLLADRNGDEKVEKSNDSRTNGSSQVSSQWNTTETLNTPRTSSGETSESQQQDGPFVVRYKIGMVDSRFDLSKEEFREEVRVAALLWEQACGGKLRFMEDENGFPISVIFDERQSKVIKLDGQKKEISDEDRVLNSLKQQVEEYKEQISNERLQLSFSREKHERDLETYNRKVDNINMNGGADDVESDDLGAERIRLEERGRVLRNAIRDHNQRIEQLNEYVNQLNEKIQAHLEKIGRFNTLLPDKVVVGQTRIVSEGSKVRIDWLRIYRFTSRQELRKILAHEFGHCLGLEHVDKQYSVMTAVENGEELFSQLKLSKEDIVELEKASASFAQRFSR